MTVAWCCTVTPADSAHVPGAQSCQVHAGAVQDNTAWICNWMRLITAHYLQLQVPTSRAKPSSRPSKGSPPGSWTQALKPTCRYSVNCVNQKLETHATCWPTAHTDLPAPTCCLLQAVGSKAGSLCCPDSQVNPVQSVSNSAFFSAVGFDDDGDGDDGSLLAAGQEELGGCGASKESSYASRLQVGASSCRLTKSTLLRIHRGICFWWH